MIIVKKNKLLLLCYILFQFVGLWAEDNTCFVKEGIYYSVSPTTKTAHVARSATFRYSGAIAIPSSVSFNGVDYPVTVIDDYAFYGSSISSVKVGANVSSIGSCAFSFCPLLNTIVVDPKNKVFFSYHNAIYRDITIGIGNIADNSPVLAPSRSAIDKQLSDIVLVSGCSETGNILSTTTVIGENAFFGTNIRELIIPSSVQKICISAFNNCDVLEHVCFLGEPPTIVLDCTPFNYNDNDLLKIYVLNSTLSGFQESGLQYYFSSIHPFGDLNLDKKLTNKDISVMVNYLLLNPVESFDTYGADMNMDSEISVADLVAIINSLN